MSVRINASGEYLRRTANLPVSTAFTMCGWARMTKRASQYQYWGLEDATSNASQYLVIGYTSGGVFELSSTGAGGGSAFASAPTDEAWFFWALSNQGTGASDAKAYWAYVTDTSFKTATGRGISFTPALMALGNDSYDEWCNAAYAYTKIFDAALTSDELWREMFTVRPGRYTNLHIFSPLWSTSDILDYSGNGKGWTAGGTLSSEDNPPISYGDDVMYVQAPAASGPTYTLSITPGSYTVTGNNATLTAARKLTATTQTYAITGNTTTLKAARKLVVTNASYAITGNNTGLYAGRKLVATSGSYSITGNDAGLYAGKKIFVTPGAYSLTGNNTGLYASRLITVNSQTYVITGYTVTLTKSGAGGPTYTLTVTPAAYAITGNDATLTASRKLTANTANYAITGSNTGLFASRLLSVTPGSYAITGNSVSLLAARLLGVTAGQYVYVGNDVILTFQGVLSGIEFNFTNPRVVFEDPQTVTFESPQSVEFEAPQTVRK